MTNIELESKENFRYRTGDLLTFEVQVEPKINKLVDQVYRRIDSTFINLKTKDMSITMRGFFTSIQYKGDPCNEIASIKFEIIETIQEDVLKSW